MEARFEYKFVRFGKGSLSARGAAYNYQDSVRRYTTESWELAQILAPGFGAFGSSKYVRVVLEREIIP